MLGWWLFGMREVREQGDRLLFAKHKPRKSWLVVEVEMLLEEQFQFEFD
jgi:hypothetical protein